MLTRIDHVMVCVSDLAEGVAAYTRLGFDVRPGGVHPGRGTHNAIAFHGQEYLEVLAVREGAGDPAVGAPSAGLLAFLARGPGIRYVALQSDDLPADVAAMRARGVEVSDVTPGSRRTPAGQELRWQSASLEGSDLPIFFIQHLTPLPERQRAAGGSGTHPNGVLRLDRVYIAVPDVGAAAGTYARILGLPVPRVQRGAVIKADMAVFDLGSTGLTVAQPVEPGPAAEALSRRGPGPFQALYRTRGMDAAARWMMEHGAPPPARAVRNTGETAILVGPEWACGAYIGLVGPP
jgi:catechol 2,3-dioxygenase-like lactoylglutathione lyase family enzyme